MKMYKTVGEGMSGALSHSDRHPSYKFLFIRLFIHVIFLFLVLSLLEEGEAVPGWWWSSCYYFRRRRSHGRSPALPSKFSAVGKLFGPHEECISSSFSSGAVAFYPRGGGTEPATLDVAAAKNDEKNEKSIDESTSLDSRVRRAMRKLGLFASGTNGGADNAAHVENKGRSVSFGSGGGKDLEDKEDEKELHSQYPTSTVNDSLPEHLPATPATSVANTGIFETAASDERHDDIAGPTDGPTASNTDDGENVDTVKPIVLNDGLDTNEVGDAAVGIVSKATINHSADTHSEEGDEKAASTEAPDASSTSGLQCAGGVCAVPGAKEEEEERERDSSTILPREADQDLCSKDKVDGEEMAKGAAIATSTTFSDADADATADEINGVNAKSAGIVASAMEDNGTDEAEEETMVAIAERLANEHGTSHNIALAALAASGGDERVASDIIKYELQVISSISDDCDEVQSLIEEGYNKDAARRALALSERNVDDARAILLAEADDAREAAEAEAQAKAEAKERARQEDEAMAAEKARAEAKMKRVNVPSNFDPMAAATTQTVTPVMPQQQQQQSTNLPPKEALKSDVVFDINSSNIYKLVIESPVPVLLDVYADWCGPCKALTPALEQMAMKGGGSFRLCKLNSDDEKALSQLLGVSALPTVFGIRPRSGQVHNSFRGMPQEEQLKSFMISLLMGTPPTNPALTDQEKYGMEEISTKLIKYASMSTFSFSSREKLQNYVQSKLDLLVDDCGGDAHIADSSATVLRSLLSNMIKNPSEKKYRKVNLTNKHIATKIVPYKAAHDILKSVGFKPDGSSKLTLGENKDVIHVAPLIVARDSIDVWTDNHRYNIAAAARKMKDEFHRAEMAKKKAEDEKQEEARRRADAEAKAKVEAGGDEDGHEDIISPCIIKLRVEGRKKVHERTFHADEPLGPAIMAALSSFPGGNDGNENGVLMTCAARRLVIKSSDATAMNATFRDHGLVPAASLVLKVLRDEEEPEEGKENTSSSSQRREQEEETREKRDNSAFIRGPADGSNDDEDGIIEEEDSKTRLGGNRHRNKSSSSLAERAKEKKKKKRGSHTMQSVGIYAKDDHAKGELFDGGGGVLYEHDVTDTEEVEEKEKEKDGGDENLGEQMGRKEQAKHGLKPKTTKTKIKKAKRKSKKDVPAAVEEG